jgi:hypothetical protein
MNNYGKTYSVNVFTILILTERFSAKTFKQNMS